MPHLGKFYIRQDCLQLSCLSIEPGEKYRRGARLDALSIDQYFSQGSREKREE